MTHTERAPAFTGSFGVPQLPKTVPGRPRVVQIIDDAFAAGPLVIMRAVYGAGKTAAAADWAAHTRQRVAWITLDDEEYPSSSLWNRILRSCSYLAAPGSAVSETIAGAVAEAESGTLLPELLLRTVADVGPVTLVLDGMKPSSDPAFLKELVRMLGSLPGFRVILTSREPFPSTQSNLLRSVDVTYIPYDSLFLSLEEVRAQVIASGSDLEPDLIWLHTYGFPMLVRALLAARDSHPISGTSRGIEKLVGSWIRSGIFETADEVEGYEEFMVKTSFAETLTVELAEKLTGRTDCAEVLRLLDGRSLVMKEGDGVYRYRPPVRTALRAELEGSHPQWVASCREVIINHFVDAGMVPRALSTAVEGRDYEAAERIVARHQGQVLFLHPDESAGILDDVPDHAMLRHPLLAMSTGLLLTRSDLSRDRGHRLLETALAGIEASRSGAKAENRMHFPLAEMIALRAAGRFSEAVRTVPRALEKFDSAFPGCPEENSGTVSSAYIQAGLTLLLEGWTKEARVPLQQAASAPASLRNRAGQLTCLGLLGLAYVLDGRVKDAEQALLAADDLFGQTALDSWLHAPYLVAKAFCFIERGDPERSLEILSTDGLDLSASEIWPLALAVRGVAEVFVYPDRVNPGDFEREISESSSRPTSGFTRSVLMSSLSAIYLYTGNAVKAAAALEGLEPRPHVQLCKARLALAEGDFAKAEKALSSISPAWQKSERAQRQELQMLAAIAGHSGRTAEAQSMFNRALHLGSRSGLGILLSILPDPAREHLPGDDAANTAMLRIPAVQAPVRLTARECIVLKKLAVAESAAAAAVELGVSLNTVKAQSRSIYRKLNVSTLRDAVTEAKALHLI